MRMMRIEAAIATYCSIYLRTLLFDRKPLQLNPLDLDPPSAASTYPLSISVLRKHHCRLLQQSGQSWGTRTRRYLRYHRSSITAFLPSYSRIYLRNHPLKRQLKRQNRHKENINSLSANYIHDFGSSSNANKFRQQDRASKFRNSNTGLLSRKFKKKIFSSLRERLVNDDKLDSDDVDAMAGDDPLRAGQKIKSPKSKDSNEVTNGKFNKKENRGKVNEFSLHHSTMSTAICVVPPDDVWDTIQRARHLARDSTFYKWPPAIRLFHPFAPKKDVPSLVGLLAEWIDDKGSLRQKLDADCLDQDDAQKYQPEFLEPFEVTLDSILILPHWEVLDARIEALEGQIPQQTILTESTAEKESRERREKGMLLIKEEEMKGKKRKKDREMSRKYRKEKKKKREDKKQARSPTKSTGPKSVNQQHLDDTRSEVYSVTTSAQDDSHDNNSVTVEDESKKDNSKKGRGYNGPCVIYLSPNDESRLALEKLRDKLRSELFPTYDTFSPSSSVSPYPERLPRKNTPFRPLLPIARFTTVGAAVKIAKILQRVWEPLTFNVTDLQFVSRNDDGLSAHDIQSSANDMSNTQTTTKQNTFRTDHPDWDIPEVRHRGKHGTLSSKSATQHVVLTSSGEVEDILQQGVYGCDAMVMLWGEEPEEALMDENASLAMLVIDEDENFENEEAGKNYTTNMYSEDEENDESNHITVRKREKISYDKIFATAEQEYQRMQAHEELSGIKDNDPSPFEFGDVDIEEWLDSDGDLLDDEGATVVVGRAQFFIGSMREYIGMPASSAIDAKGRIMGNGVSAVARRRGSVHRLSESWEPGDYGQKEQDLRT